LGKTQKEKTWIDANEERYNKGAGFEKK